jgi:hypothetical protein
LKERQQFFDILKENTLILSKKILTKKVKKVRKGAWRMPWLSEAMKDVISCDKLRGGANMNLSEDFRMGKPGT